MPEGAQFISSGTMGDLAGRLVGPAAFNLHLAGQLPAEVHRLILSRTDED